jgi:hypothetical protein
MILVQLKYENGIGVPKIENVLKLFIGPIRL